MCCCLFVPVSADNLLSEPPERLGAVFPEMQNLRESISCQNQRYELCSDKCRKKQFLQNKREFDERARENNYDLLYKNECQNWRKKNNNAKKTSGFPADRLEEMLAAFESFKKEALQRKQAVKKKIASSKEFCISPLLVVGST